MAWTVPRTWVAGEMVTHTLLNQDVRDNQTAFFGSRAIVTTSESTTSTVFVDLATSGPAVTVTTLTEAFVWLGATYNNNSATRHAIMGVAVSGATTIAASADHRALILRAYFASCQFSSAKFFKQTGLTAGSNTFTAKYTAFDAGTAAFQDREMIVIPVGLL